MTKNSALFCITFLFSCSVQTCFSQDETSFGGFLASPVGDFKSTSLDKGGFAKPGGGIVFDVKYTTQLLPKGWNFSFHSTYQWNDMDTQEVSRKFTEQLGYKTVVSDSKFTPVLTTIGPGYDFSIAERVKFGLKGGIGFMFNNTKAFTIEVYDASDNIIANELVNFSNRIAFAYMLGAELKFEIVKDVFGITLYSDYTSATQQTELTFSSKTPAINSFQKLEYLNTGIKLVLLRKTGPSG